LQQDDNDRIAPAKNDRGIRASIGENGIFYCGSRLGFSCGCCNGNCGPNNGCCCL